MFVDSVDGHQTKFAQTESNSLGSASTCLLRRDERRGGCSGKVLRPSPAAPSWVTGTMQTLTKELGGQRASAQQYYPPRSYKPQPRPPLPELTRGDLVSGLATWESAPLRCVPAAERLSAEGKAAFPSGRGQGHFLSAGRADRRARRPEDSRVWSAGGEAGEGGEAGGAPAPGAGSGAGAPGTPGSQGGSARPPAPGSRGKTGSSGPGAPGARSFLEPGPEGRRGRLGQLSLSPNSGVSARAASRAPGGVPPGGGGGEAGLGPLPAHAVRAEAVRARSLPPRGAGPPTSAAGAGPGGGGGRPGPYLRLCTSSRRGWLPGRPLGWTSWCLCRLWCTRMNEEAAAAAGAAPRGDETPRAQPRRRRRRGGDRPGPGGGGRGGGGGPRGGDGSRAVAATISTNSGDRRKMGPAAASPTPRAPRAGPGVAAAPRPGLVLAAPPPRPPHLPVGLPEPPR